MTSVNLKIFGSGISAGDENGPKLRWSEKGFFSIGVNEFCKKAVR